MDKAPKALKALKARGLDNVDAARSVPTRVERELGLGVAELLGLGVGGFLLELFAEAGVLLEFEFVESLAVDAVDVGLGDEGVFVDALDDAEDVDGFDFTAHDEEELDGMLGVPAHAVDDGDSAACVVVDGGGDELPFA